MLSRRWLVFALVVALLATLAWWLGEWQFGRLEDRKERNAIIRANETQDPAPVTDVLALPGRGLDPDREWRLVSATGTYAVDETVIVRYRTRDGRAGVDVVVPLRLADGTLVAVDRGWLATQNQGTADPGDVPAPPAGEVTITGYARVDGTGDSVTVDDDASTRAISSRELGEHWGQPTRGGFVDLASETPSPVTPLALRELPELDNGPHFFYGLQWWFFGVLAVFGFFYLAYDERRRGPRGERTPSGDGSRPARPARERKVRQSNVNPAYQRRRD